MVLCIAACMSVLEHNACLCSVTKYRVDQLLSPSKWSHLRICMIPAYLGTHEMLFDSQTFSMQSWFNAGSNFSVSITLLIQVQKKKKKIVIGFYISVSRKGYIRANKHCHKSIHIQFFLSKQTHVKCTNAVLTQTQHGNFNNSLELTSTDTRKCQIRTHINKKNQP